MTDTTTCAVGPCNEPREEGRAYCAKHGPKKQATPPKQAWRQYRAERAESKVETSFGSLNPVLRCPHCQATGQVRSKDLLLKQGHRSVAKMATFGLLGSGRSQVRVTELYCERCHSTWRA